MATSQPKYSRIEHERKWLVRPGPVELLNPKPFSRRLVDRYLECGRLRLRSMEESDGLPTVYKLTKKYPADSLDAQPIVSIFLSRDEYAALLAIPGHDLVKTRRYDEVGGWLFSVDTFDGLHAGLVLCEVEAESAKELARVAPPPYVLREVTHEVAYTGAALAMGGLILTDVALTTAGQRLDGVRMQPVGLDEP
jgi:CYTH domain-containing protein